MNKPPDNSHDNKIIKFKKPILETNKGSITPAQAAQGIQAAQENARELLKDAEILLANER